MDDLLLAHLRSHRIFAALSDIEAETLASAGKVLALRPEQELFRAGDRADGFYIVLNGALDVLVEERTLARIDAGEVVGEMGLVTAHTRSATVRAIAPVRVWHLDGRGFEALLRAGDPMATGILLGVARDLGRRFRDVVNEAARLVPDVAKSPGGPELLDRLHWGDL